MHCRASDKVVPNPNPCPPFGCGSYRVTAKACGLKGLDLGSHGYVEPAAISNPKDINLTPMPSETDQELYVTIISKTHIATRDAVGRAVAIQATGFPSGHRRLYGACRQRTG